MPYRRSRARKRFDADTATLLSTVREAYSRRCPSSSVRQLALCSAVVLCSARLESYIEDLLGDWSRSLNAPHVTTDRLPKRTRAFLLSQAGVSAYRRYVCYDDETHLLAKLEPLVGQLHYDLGIDGRAVPPFPLQSIYSDRKYPSPKNLRRLFNRLGVSNIFDDLNRVARRDTQALLTSFNDLRTELAHVGMPVGLTPDDIKAGIGNVRSLVGYIDRAFYSLVAKSIGAAS